MNEQRRARNQEVVEEFRGNGGKVGGMFEGVPLLLLHHTGARSGAAHVTPLAYLEDAGRWVVVAANGGRAHHPAWYFNVRAYPAVALEVGTEAHRAVARPAEGAEREELCARFRAESRFFGGFEEQTDREIPVVVLEPLAAEGESPLG
ncbi:MAG TPA: nitroreductase family deazaflavin-dependent oxidoreductase [Actinocrinis sp.]|jgi:deazaflavin-dependent oxidoreductase (nitroreductase family)